MSDAKERGPESEQAAYDLGYSNPAKSCREYTWRHLVFLNAYFNGQCDYQNQCPRNRDYDPDQYDSGGERVTASHQP